jgi:DNA-binding GntR family transcriptional regulator
MARNEKTVGKFFEENGPKQLDHDKSAGGQIFETLKQAILNMDIVPGSLIPEGEVGKRFSASRTPVREALLQLRAAGLVITSAGRGNFATRLSETRIREAQFIREVLELGVVKTLCENGLQEEHRLELLANLKAQEQAVSAGGKSEFPELDDSFHLILARATGFPRMCDILTREKMALDRLRVLSLDDEAHMQSLLHEHVAIFEAIDARDWETAKKHTKLHLTSVLNTLDVLAARHKEYFE